MRAAEPALNHFANQVLPGLSEGFVLITGSEDITIPTQTDHRWAPFCQQTRTDIKTILAHPHLRHWFVENLDAQIDPRMSPLPTGMVFPNTGGTLEKTPEIAVPDVPPLGQRPLRILCAHRVRDGAQWELRKRLFERAARSWGGFCTIPDGEVCEAEFARLIEAHSFVICAEGGGLDPSPKAWQTLLHGAIPIIRATPTSGAYQELPVVRVDDWETSPITTSELRIWREGAIKAFDAPGARQKMVELLAQDHWWRKVERLARS